MSTDELIQAWRARAESALERALSANDRPERLLAAMRHASLGGGKRMRPLLVHAAGHAFGGDHDALDAPATAVELIHAFSLVHDDLPAMDDDDLRRGQPTVHVAWDEATAILAGDALHALAFSVLADAPLPATVRVDLLRELASASGVDGMCAGQALDMEATGKSLDLEALARLHALKTGALIRAAVRMGALAANAPADALPRLDRYARALGLAFQIRDDILDVEGDAAQLGKTAGKDQAQGKNTYPRLLGTDGSRAKLDALVEEMEAALAPFGERSDALRVLAGFAVGRACSPAPRRSVT
jgi:farnesyl diphosphate synthase